jgi:hypothetical protein
MRGFLRNEGNFVARVFDERLRKGKREEEKGREGKRGEERGREGKRGEPSLRDQSFRSIALRSNLR